MLDELPEPNVGTRRLELTRVTHRVSLLNEVVRPLARDTGRDEGEGYRTVKRLWTADTVPGISGRITVRSQTDTTPRGARRVELEVTVNDQPWATYTATISTDDDRTSVDVEYTSNRRFGLRRIPQQIVAERYRNEALTAQGYTVVERDSNFGI
ncbi:MULTISPECIES: hypothetical protein [Haloarcula]|uniref:hypothetical protein n=1 Tax=Haloarcula TaxID=2237 RepID=UPI0023ED3E97|nr:hypothetical protein [Halomicroarcula sp. XH51]